MNKMTAAQFLTAYKLAVSYGHLWVQTGGEPGAGPTATAQELAEAMAGRAPDADHIRYSWNQDMAHAGTYVGGPFEFGGILVPAIEHVTCTGRTTWSIRTDGSIQVDLRHPGATAQFNMSRNGQEFWHRGRWTVEAVRAFVQIRCALTGESMPEGWAWFGRGITLLQLDHQTVLRLRAEADEAQTQTLSLR